MKIIKWIQKVVKFRQKKSDNKWKDENLNSEGGYKEGFVSVSKSTLDPDNFKFTSKDYTYAQRYDEIVKNVWDSFFGSKSDNQAGVQGRFYNEKNDSETEQYKKYGLKKSDDIVKKFSENISEGATEAVINAVLALENVTQGWMTAGNMNNFFTPIIEKINNQKK